MSVQQPNSASDDFSKFPSRRWQGISTFPFGSAVARDSGQAELQFKYPTLSLLFFCSVFLFFSATPKYDSSNPPVPEGARTVFFRHVTGGVSKTKWFKNGKEEKENLFQSKSSCDHSAPFTFPFWPFFMSIPIPGHPCCPCFFALVFFCCTTTVLLLLLYCCTHMVGWWVLVGGYFFLLCTVLYCCCTHMVGG